MGKKGRWVSGGMRLEGWEEEMNDGEDEVEE